MFLVCSKHKMKNKIIKYTLAIIISLMLGTLSGFSTISEIQNWYSSINKPSWNPPSWLSGPVWSILYALIGVSFAMVWTSQTTNKNKAYTFFFIQFGLNLLWSFIFFKMHAIGFALIEMTIMCLFIVLTIIEFKKHSKAAALLLIPYLIWVSFASVLTASIFYLN